MLNENKPPPPPLPVDGCGVLVFERDERLIGKVLFGGGVVGASLAGCDCWCICEVVIFLKR